jgi:signal transduction histidine kinase
MDVDSRQLVSMIRRLGFDMVCEVAFGADIVANAYKKLIEKNPDKCYIATTCPGIVAYVEKYHPELVKHLAPIASPMVATARALRLLNKDPLKIVFIGPCLAKKAEAVRDHSEQPDVDAVLTFVELRKMFEDSSIKPEKDKLEDFAPPHPGLGALFPLRRGMLQAADLPVDLLTGDILAADGKDSFAQAIKEFENENFDARLLEILCCEGCIMGCGMNTDKPYFSRRSAVSKYVNDRVKHLDAKEQKETYDKIMAEIDLKVEYDADDHRLPMPSKEEIDAILKKLGKLKPEDELDCGACGYGSCREHAIAIHKGMAESEMCLPYTIERLKRSLEDLHLSNSELETTRQALFNSEKLASMGQLSAGIAHEINNPLGVILLNGSLLLDTLDKDSEDYEDMKMIVDQAERCKKIVSSLLNFARKNKVALQSTNIKSLIENCIPGIVKPGNIEIEVEHDLEDPMCEVDPDQIVQVLTNLAVNAFEAMPGGGKVKITTSDREDPETVKIVVEDNGPGIPKQLRSKIFEPLFTTKQIGQGTGLGLAVIYGIIKMHRGQILLESNANPDEGPTWTKFIVKLPKQGVQQY